MVCHTCDNRRCIQPDHLFIGTHADNMADMARKGRARSGSKPKLQLSDYETIRDRARCMSKREVASLYGISSWHVTRIERGYLPTMFNQKEEVM